MWVHLTPKSSNSKVGKIPVSTTESASCPNECPMKDDETCYAKSGFHLRMHWDKVGEGQRGDNWKAFCNRVRRFAIRQIWRHNQAGDLPQRKDGKIARRKALQLADASQHTRGWTYTHYDPTDKYNAETIRRMNEFDGLTVNLSADSLTQADEYAKLGIAPVTVVLPENTPHRGNKTPDGLPIVVCPAQTADDVTCEKCKLCTVKNRQSVVGFLAHGTKKRALTETLNQKDAK